MGQLSAPLTPLSEALMTGEGRLVARYSNRVDILSKWVDRLAYYQQAQRQRAQLVELEGLSQASVVREVEYRRAVGFVNQEVERSTKAVAPLFDKSAKIAVAYALPGPVVRPAEPAVKPGEPNVPSEGELSQIKLPMERVVDPKKGEILFVKGVPFKGNYAKALGMLAKTYQNVNEYGKPLEEPQQNLNSLFQGVPGRFGQILTPGNIASRTSNLVARLKTELAGAGLGIISVQRDGKFLRIVDEVDVDDEEVMTPEASEIAERLLARATIEGPGVSPAVGNLEEVAADDVKKKPQEFLLETR